MSKIKFIESSHRYVSETGLDLISVSKFTERFKEKVDWKAIAKKSAEKLTKAGTPTTTEEILKKWERKRDTSASIGTLFHALKEQELLADTSVTVMTGDSEGLDKWSMPINDIKDNTIYPELMIYDLEHMICGQSDKVIVKNGKIHIWDYKTDAEIKFEAYSSTWVKPKKLLAPLTHLDDCNGNVYSVKMSLYMYMLWRANKGRFKPGDIILEHVHLQRDPEDDNIPILKDGAPIVLKIEQIKLPYRKKEVMDMLKTLK